MVPKFAQLCNDPTVKAVFDRQVVLNTTLLDALKAVLRANNKEQIDSLDACLSQMSRLAWVERKVIADADCFVYTTCELVSMLLSVNALTVEHKTLIARVMDQLCIPK